MLKLVRGTLALGILAAVVAGPALAAPAVIRLKSGETIEAHRIQAEAITGIAWMRTAQAPGTPRVRLWELESLRFVGQEMDEYNSLPRRYAGGFGARVVQDAESYIAQEGTPARGFSAAEWRGVQLGARYYKAQGLRLQGKTEEAVAAFRDYMTRAENNMFTEGITAGVRFRSAITGRTHASAGGLHRYYLDALETLGYIYLENDDLESANTFGFEPLRALADALNLATGGAPQYFDWPLRALRRLALEAEDNEDWTAASQAYAAVEQVAMRRDGGSPSRDSIQAQLWMGFMNARAGSPAAGAAFINKTRQWEQAHRRDLNQMRPPARNWMSPDEAFAVAGAYVGQGMVEANSARDAEGWARVLRSNSQALSMFEAGPEIRSLALLGAANAAAKLAELNAANETIANTYAVLAEKYLNELTSLYGSTRPASDKSIPGIETAINNHKSQGQE